MLDVWLRKACLRSLKGDQKCSKMKYNYENFNLNIYQRRLHLCKCVKKVRSGFNSELSITSAQDGNNMKDLVKFTPNIKNFWYCF